jgi:predicted transcriptional regulator
LSDGEKRRGYTEIVVTILTIAKDGELITNITKKARLNAQQMSLYMKRLVNAGLVEVKNFDGKTVCSATEKADQYLKQYGVLREILHSNCGGQTRKRQKES